MIGVRCINGVCTFTRNSQYFMTAMLTGAMQVTTLSMARKIPQQKRKLKKNVYIGTGIVKNIIDNIQSMVQVSIECSTEWPRQNGNRDKLDNVLGPRGRTKS